MNTHQTQKRDDAPGRAYDSTRLYDALAGEYDVGYATPSHRRAYDLLAWDQAVSLLPARACTVIDAGCGTGRWAEMLVQRGHRVIGIEQSPEMVRQIEARSLGRSFTLLQESMETVAVAPNCADAVFAMGSVQFTADPARQIARFASWVRPGGVLVVYVDSLVALVLELMRLGKVEEALLRLRTGVGVWETNGCSAQVHLYDAVRLANDFRAAGLAEVRPHGLLVSASAIGSGGCTRAMQTDPDAFLALQRELSADPRLADVGKHILMSGRRPRA